MGLETIAASALTIDINAAGFSPLNSVHNSGSGFGNAGWDYLFNVSNVLGNGLTFVDGSLTSIDLTADVSILPRFGGRPAFAFANSYDGTLAIVGNQFRFDVDVTQDNTTPLGAITDSRIVFNRGGTITAVVPEPGSVVLFGLGLTLVTWRRKRN